MKVQLFWHVARMGNWIDVAEQQSKLFQSAGLSPKIGVVGLRPNRQWATRFLKQKGEVVYASNNVREFETPTLQKVWEWAKEHPEDASIYCHTKGVSKPCEMRTAWRKLMEYWVVSQWQNNLKLLEDHDAVGVNWRTSAPRWPDCPHFAGTFWMARNDWLAKLASPIEHRDRGNPAWAQANQQAIQMRRASWQRMHAEMWIGSAPNIRVHSHACYDAVLCRIRFLRTLLKSCGHPEYQR